MTRSIVIAIAVTAVLWWLFRPRRRARRTAWSEPQPTYQAVRTFRTTGGVATTLYEATWRNGGPVQRWHTWTCDCGGGVEGYQALRLAVRDAISHYEGHGR